MADSMRASEGMKRPDAGGRRAWGGKEGGGL